MFPSGILAVKPILALLDSSCFNCGIQGLCCWGIITNVLTSNGTPPTNWSL
jgi:hypothetical protein